MLTSFSVGTFILNVLYPPTCVGCERDGSWLCEACLQAISLDAIQGDTVSVGRYANPTLRGLLTHLKYRSATCVIDSLRTLVRRFRSEHVGVWPWAGEPSLTLCGVPSDTRRMRERGIDHVEHLLNIVQTELVPWATRVECLRRTRHVTQNAALPANKLRHANVRGIFESYVPITGAVLLVDDVYTTGATWEEAARMLREAGATKVYGFVFARG